MLIIGSIKGNTNQIEEVVRIQLLACKNHGNAKMYTLHLWGPTSKRTGCDSWRLQFHPSCCCKLQVVNRQFQYSHENLVWLRMQNACLLLFVSRVLQHIAIVDWCSVLMAAGTLQPFLHLWNTTTACFYESCTCHNTRLPML